MKSGTNDEKRWVIDVDSKLDGYLLAVREVIEQCQGKYETNEIELLHTAHGYHIITHPFNLQQFQKLMKERGLEADVKKEGLTLLYAYLKE
jgi:chromosome segregation and condensation protein ScpB